MNDLPEGGKSHVNIYLEEKKGEMCEKYHVHVVKGMKDEDLFFFDPPW
jgi:hypothetical protein